MSAAYTVAIEDAIFDWVAAGSGITVDWAVQNTPRPTTPYISMRAIALVAGGLDWLDHDHDGGGAPGAKIIYKSRGTRRLTLSLQCFGGDATGLAAPLAFLEAVRASRILPSNHDALAAAGVGIASIGPVLALEGSTNRAILEPRAVMEVGIHLASEITETGTFIEFVEITNEIADPETIQWVPLDPSP